MAATCACLRQVKICNFGLSKYNSCSTNHTANTANDYTLEYTSPKRLHELSRSAHDDVYAFGILMYFIATSRSPFIHVSRHKLKDEVIRGTRPNIRAWASGTSSRPAVEQEVVQAYCELAEQCWREQPEERPDCPQILSRLSQMAATLPELGRSAKL
jgi:serine/threonine protein kinase